VLTIEGLETYILAPRDPADFDLLLEAIRRLAPALALREPTASSLATRGELLRLAGIGEQQQSDLVRLAADEPDFWSAVRARPDLAPQADRLRYVSGLDALTGGNVVLTAALQGAVPQATSLRTLAFHLDDDEPIHVRASLPHAGGRAIAVRPTHLPSASASVRIVRNLSMRKRRPFEPTRSCA
jgi:hypothetical protein